MIGNTESQSANPAVDVVSAMLSGALPITDPKKRVRVVIPCYNQAEYLSEAVESVLSQTHTNIQVIIIDDGSTDNTTDIAIGFCNEDNRIAAYSCHNRGLVEARNFGANLDGNYEYLLFLDSDDTIAPGYLTAAVETLSVTLADIAYPTAYMFGDVCRQWDTGPMTIDALKEKSNVPYCSLMKRSLFSRIGGFSTSMNEGYEDWEFWLRAARLGAKSVRIEGGPLFNYRIRSESMLSKAREKHDELKKRLLRLNGFEETSYKSEIERLKLMSLDLASFKRKKVNILMPSTLQCGATDALISLTDLLNSCDEYDCCLYGPHAYPKGKCNYGHHSTLEFSEDAFLIVGRTEFANIPPARKIIITSHEKEYWDLSKKDIPWADEVHFLNESHRRWHGISTKSFICPNAAPKITIDPQNDTQGVAGVVGRVEPHKRTHLSIGAALADGFSKVLIFGTIEDQTYFIKKVLPLIEKYPEVSLVGYTEKEEIYSRVGAIYSASKSECASLVEAECAVTGVNYVALHHTDGPDIRTDEEILSIWKQHLA